MPIKLDKGLVTFFDVEECGFYQTKQKQDNIHICGDMNQTVKRVHNWVKSRHSFDYTSPVDTNNKNKSFIYCKHVATDETTGDTLFVFWKSSPENDGKLNGVYADSKVNGETKDTHKLDLNIGDKRLIPGQPMYYWFMPTEKLIASIKFEDSISETNEILQYIKNCIQLRIPNKIKKESESVRYNGKLNKDIIVKKISLNVNIDGKRVSAFFSMNAKIKQIKIGIFCNESITKLAKKITHVVIRDTISTKQEVTGSELYKKINSFFGGDNEVERKKHVEYISEECLTSESLQAIINEYENNEIFKDQWYDIGFRTDSSSQTYWFSAHRASEHITVDKSFKKDDSYYKSEYLLAALINQKPEMLLRIISPIEDKTVEVGKEKMLKDIEEAANA